MNTHSDVYTQRHIHTEIFTQRDENTHRDIYTPYTHRRLHTETKNTETCTHGDAYTQRRIQTNMHMHREAYTHRHTHRDAHTETYTNMQRQTCKDKLAKTNMQRQTPANSHKITCLKRVANPTWTILMYRMSDVRNDSEHVYACQTLIGLDDSVSTKQWNMSIFSSSFLDNSLDFSDLQSFHE